MIIGLQPNHFRFCWHQTQQHGPDHTYYLQKSLLDFGCESITNTENSALEAIEPHTLHYFDLYLVAGPYVQSGFYRWSYSENFSQLASRQGWQVLAGPHAASFEGYTADSSSCYFRNLRLYTGPEANEGEEGTSLRTEVGYTSASSSHWLSLVCVMRGFRDLNNYRPLMVIEFAPAQNLTEGQRVFLTEVELSMINQHRSRERVWWGPYRGRSVWEEES